MSETIEINYDKVAKRRSGPTILKSFTPGAGFQKLSLLANKGVGNVNLTAESDIENLKEIIRVGKEQGVSEMNIISSRDTGIDAGADLNISGTPVKVQFKLGAKGENVINVKYK